MLPSPELPLLFCFFLVKPGVALLSPLRRPLLSSGGLHSLCCRSRGCQSSQSHTSSISTRASSARRQVVSDTTVSCLAWRGCSVAMESTTGPGPWRRRPSFSSSSSVALLVLVFVLQIAQQVRLAQGTHTTIASSISTHTHTRKKEKGKVKGWCCISI